MKNKLYANYIYNIGTHLLRKENVLQMISRDNNYTYVLFIIIDIYTSKF